MQAATSYERGKQMKDCVLRDRVVICTGGGEEAGKGALLHPERSRGQKRETPHISVSPAPILRLVFMGVLGNNAACLKQIHNPL